MSFTCQVADQDEIVQIVLIIFPYVAVDSSYTCVNWALLELAGHVSSQTWALLRWYESTFLVLCYDNRTHMPPAL